MRTLFCVLAALFFSACSDDDGKVVDLGAVDSAPVMEASVDLGATVDAAPVVVDAGAVSDQ